MTYSSKDLDREIVEVCEELIGSGGSAPKSWLVTAVMNRHPAISGEDKDFALYGAHFCVTSGVERYFRRSKASEQTGEGQFTIDGFEHLQAQYLIERDGEVRPVAITDATDDELLWKANQLERYGRGAIAHARELRRYVSMVRDQRHLQDQI